MDMMCTFLPGDPRLVEQIVKELKSQGIFDQFRKECISDVDTKPAYQNLRQRVEGSVSSFLQEQTWSPDMNKNQVREMLRKHINESGFLETGVERIVDQVVNPKINSVFIPKVDDVMYAFLGIDRPKEKKPSTLEINTAFDLLPKDLEAVSPELPEEKVSVKEETDGVKLDEMPTNGEVHGEKILPEENSVDSQSSASHDSNNSLKQDSVMSLNSSESRMSLSVNSSKIELEDSCLSQKSSDSITKTDVLDEKTCSENGMETKEEMENPPETNSDKSSEATKTEENKYKSKDKKRDKHHSSSDRSKSRNDKNRDKSRSEKSKKEDKDGKSTDEKKYKIPKLSDKNKDLKLKDKDEKQRSEKGKSEKDKKYDKDKKSKHSSEKSSSSSDKSKRRDKDDKRDKKDTHKSDRNKDDKKSSSSNKRESSSKDKDKDRSSRVNKDEDEKNKNEHSSSSSKSKKDEDKSKASHRKDEKEDRKRKRRSKDDHHSSKEKRSGGRSSDRDSDGPSSSKRPNVSPESSNGDYSNQQSNQKSVTLNSESSSGYSGNSDKVEEKYDEAGKNAAQEMQKIKIPKFASNLNEAMKIMKIRKLLKKLDHAIKTNPQNPEVQGIMKDIEQLTSDVKRDQTIQCNPGEENEDMVGDVVEDSSKAVPINIDEFISSPNISMAKWNALEAKFMEQITDVDYNSYESPYVDDEDVPGNKNENMQNLEDKLECDTEVTSQSNILEVENFQKELSSERIIVSDLVEGQTNEENKELQNSSDEPKAECSNTQSTKEIPNSDEVDSVEENENVNERSCKDLKQQAIVVLHKHALTEEMIKLKSDEKIEDNTIDEILDGTSEEIEKENIEINEEKVQNETEDREKISREHTENNLVLEESNSKNVEIYNLQNSCEVCLDSRGDVCKGFEQSHDLRPLNFIRCIMNILENQISRFKEKNIECFSTRNSSFDYTKKRKVNEKKTDIANNNSASERQEVESIGIIPIDVPLASKKVIPQTNSKTKNKCFPKENELRSDNLEVVVNQTAEMKSKRKSGSMVGTPLRANDQVNTNRSSERKTRPNQRYSSEDLYKPRIFFRKSGRDSKNP